MSHDVITMIITTMIVLAFYKDNSHNLAEANEER